MIRHCDFLALDLGIVMQNRSTIARVTHVELEAVAPVFQSVVEGGERILGRQLSFTPTQSQERQRPNTAMAEQQRTWIRVRQS
jgi:hypothetical protein